MPNEEKPLMQRCGKCAGQGKVDSKEGRPWTRLDPEHTKRVRRGQVNPANCLECKGTGKVEDPKTKAK